MTIRCETDNLQEGILTLSFAVWSAFAMARSPTQTKYWFRPKGWFTEREESKWTSPMPQSKTIAKLRVPEIIVNRVLRDDPSKSDMHNREGITMKMMWKTLKDYDMW